MSGQEPVSIARVAQRIDALGRQVAAGIIGFLAQCAVCPQRAVLAFQPAGEWVCPRCAEVVDADEIDDVEDYLPISKVRG